MTNLLTALTITLATNWVPVHTEGTNQVQAGVIYQVEQLSVERNGATRTFLLSSNVTDEPLLRRRIHIEVSMFNITNWAPFPGWYMTNSIIELLPAPTNEALDISILFNAESNCWTIENQSRLNKRDSISPGGDR